MMKPYKINIFVIFTLILFLACSAYASSPIGECRLLQIYVDSNNRIFWNIFYPTDSLPKQLPIIQFASDTTDCEINTIYFEHLIKGLYNQNRKPSILISPHPNSHYSCFDQIFDVIYKIEKECMAQYSKNKENHSEQELKSNFPKVTKIKPKISIARPYCINFAVHAWVDRDDRIIDSVYNFYDLSSAGKITNPVEDQFSERINNGYWDSEVINYDPSPGVPISRNEVGSTAPKKHNTRILEPDTHKPSDYLPGVDEFVPVEIPAEHIYYHSPEYPRLAQNAGMEAIVWVKALVDKEGNVRDAIILKSSGSKAGFDEAATRAAYKCRYKPAIQNGQPVAVWVSYEVEFYCLKDK